MSRDRSQKLDRLVIQCAEDKESWKRYIDNLGKVSYIYMVYYRWVFQRYGSMYKTPGALTEFKF